MRIFAFLLLAATVVACAPSSTAFASMCQGSMKAKGPANPDEGQARRRAKLAWQIRAESIHGVSYKSWEAAQAKVIVCHDVAPSSHFCVARARPCAVLSPIPDVDRVMN
jgi:hypothetical protein